MISSNGLIENIIKIIEKNDSYKIKIIKTWLNIAFSPIHANPTQV